MGALSVFFALFLVAAIWASFTIGRASADRRRTLNHHQMMILLVDLRMKDDTITIMPTETRTKLDHLLDDYERLDLDDRP